MKRLNRIQVAALFALLSSGGCAQEAADTSADAEQAVSTASSGTVTATLTTTSDWGAGFCDSVTIVNKGSAVTNWTVKIATNGATVGQIWSASQTTSGTVMTVTPAAHNQSIPGGGSVNFGYCGTGTQRPTLTSITVSGGGGGTGGSSATGGTSAKGGSSATGGTSAKGGSSATGGTTAKGGSTAAGGTKATGGTTAKGGTTAAGGTTAKGGTTAAGGAIPTGADQCKPIGWATRAGRTGGAVSVTGGGNATPVVVKTFAELSSAAAGTAAKVIYVDGTVGSGWSGTSGDRLEIGSNKTIIGLRAGTQLKAPIHIKNSSNVIVRNLVIRGPGSNSDQAWDNLNIEGSSKNIWIDHCEFWDGQDGNADVVKGADNVTFTWNIFGYSLPGHTHNLSNLIASSDNEPVSEGKLDITFMFNWWKAADQRQPRCRYGAIHVVNNLYTANTSISNATLGISNGYMCNVKTENNHFVGQKQPIDLGKQAGAGSVQEAIGNLFEQCSGNQKGSGTAFTPPYEYKSFMVPASSVKALVEKNAGATLASPTSCR